MQLGVMLEGQEGLTWGLWRRLMASVEELGFESLWRSDHCMSLVDSNRDALETWVALTLTAAETTRLRFGSLVSPMTFRHPSLLARMAAAVDTLSGGRLVLGVGAGWNAQEHRAFGIPFPPLKERMLMLEEGIEVIVRLLGDGPVIVQLQDLAHAGVQRVMFQHNDQTDFEALELLASDVMPAVAM